MQRAAFHYSLPEQLIARYPAEQRTASRLLQLEGVTGAVSDHTFTDIEGFLRAGDLLVFNDTRVIPARMFGQKESGGKVEVLIERLLDDRRLLAHVRASKSPKPGAKLLLGGDRDQAVEWMMEGRRGELFELRLLVDEPMAQVLERIGHMPLPPYIDRADESSDQERYQTVYSRNPGAVAAPTAGLHFDDQVLQRLADKGVQQAFVTLHVGAGTFQPVRADNIHDHQMHSEWVEVSEAVCRAVAETKVRGGRVIAVGTTSVRCLETAAAAASETTLSPYRGETDIFIYPGYQFQVIDCLLTNFHLPESTLLMLVSALAGYQNTMAAYQHAIDQQYRFFSYGDCMFIQRNPNAHLEEVK